MQTSHLKQDSTSHITLATLDLSALSPRVSSDSYSLDSFSCMIVSDCSEFKSEVKTA